MKYLLSVCYALAVCLSEANAETPQAPLPPQAPPLRVAAAQRCECLLTGICTCGVNCDCGLVLVKKADLRPLPVTPGAYWASFPDGDPKRLQLVGTDGRQLGCYNLEKRLYWPMASNGELWPQSCELPILTTTASRYESRPTGFFESAAAGACANGSCGTSTGSGRFRR